MSKGKSKTALGLLAGFGVLAIGGLALAAGGSSKKKTTAPDVVDKTDSDAAAVQIISQLNQALYTETDPAKLLSLATQAELQANSGAYSQAMSAKILDAVGVLRQRAATLQSGNHVATVTHDVNVVTVPTGGQQTQQSQPTQTQQQQSDAAALQILTQMNTALYTETDPAKLVSLAQQAQLQANSGAYSPAMSDKITQAAKALVARADQIRGAVVQQATAQGQNASAVAAQQAANEAATHQAAADAAAAQQAASAAAAQKSAADAAAAQQAARQAAADAIAHQQAQDQAAAAQKAQEAAAAQQAAQQAAADAAAHQAAADQAAAQKAAADAAAAQKAQEAAQHAAQQPSTEPVAADTLLVAQILLNDEGTTHWKRIVPELKPWQQKRNLTADGEFGTGSALAMAKEIGTIPIIRYWPKGSYPGGKWLTDYRNALNAIAATAPDPRAGQLRYSAMREKGQGWGTSLGTTSVHSDPNADALTLLNEVSQAYAKSTDPSMLESMATQLDFQADSGALSADMTNKMRQASSLLQGRIADLNAGRTSANA